jgi:hypothetical protein
VRFRPDRIPQPPDADAYADVVFVPMGPFLEPRPVRVGVVLSADHTTAFKDDETDNMNLLCTLPTPHPDGSMSATFRPLPGKPCGSVLTGWCCPSVELHDQSVFASCWPSGRHVVDRGYFHRGWDAHNSDAVTLRWDPNHGTIHKSITTDGVVSAETLLHSDIAERELVPVVVLPWHPAAVSVD